MTGLSVEELFALANQAQPNATTDDASGTHASSSVDVAPETNHAETCPGCGGSQLLSDTVEGNIVCTDCGCTQQDLFASLGTEESEYETMQRCGYPVDVHMGDHPGTHVDFTSCRTYEEKRLFNMSRWNSYSNNLRQHWKDQNTAVMYGLPLNSRAQYLIRQITKHQCFRERTRRAMIGACYLHSIQSSKEGQTGHVLPSQVARQLDVPCPMVQRAQSTLDTFLREREGNVAYGVRKSVLPSCAQTSIEGEDYVLSICRAHRSIQGDRTVLLAVRKGAKHWIDRTKHDSRIRVRKPVAYASAAVSLAMVDREMDPFEDTTAFPVTQTTIQTIMNQMRTIVRRATEAESSTSTEPPTTVDRGASSMSRPKAERDDEPARDTIWYVDVVPNLNEPADPTPPS